MSQVKDNLFVGLQYLLPHHALSRLVGGVAECTLPWVKDPLIKLFIQQFGVDMSEAKVEDPKAYANFNAFFTRELKNGARSFAAGEMEIACPADGTVSQLGDIDEGRIFQAKGRHYTTEELLGGDKNLAQSFQDGKFATIYLSPKDYHRLHMPMDGTLTEMKHVPGRLFSVNPATADRVPRLFARNERVVCCFDTKAGPVALVLVGAMIVASVETTWAGLVAPTGLAVSSHRYNDKAPTFKKGDEFARFKLGSTIIVLMPKGSASWSEHWQAGSTTRLGEAMGTLI